MTRDEQEMALWAAEYSASSWLWDADRAAAADAAVAEFRKRYPVEPAAPAPVWYDEPPRPGEYHVVGLPRVCWVDEDVVYLPEWDRVYERPRIRELPRGDRRVCPIVKPQEPSNHGD